MFGINIDWKKTEECTAEEINELLKYIEQLLELKNNFDVMGIECFEVYLKNDAEDFEKVAIDLVCQGCMPDIVSIILSNLIQSTSLSRVQYLKDILFSTFMLMLQKGTFCSQNIKRILLSYLGIRFSKYILTENL